MTETTTKVMTCDRCGFVQSIPTHQASSIYPWGLVAARQHNGPKRIGGFGGGEGDKAKDICPDCVKELDAWWYAVPGAVSAADEAIEGLKADVRAAEAELERVLGIHKLVVKERDAAFVRRDDLRVERDAWAQRFSTLFTELTGRTAAWTPEEATHLARTAIADLRAAALRLLDYSAKAAGYEAALQRIAKPHLSVPGTTLVAGIPTVRAGAVHFWSLACDACHRQEIAAAALGDPDAIKSEAARIAGVQA